MRFCKECGTVLNLFDPSDKEFCSACTKYEKKQAPTPEAKKDTKDPTTLLSDTELSYENDKLVLRSKEGWEIWSAPASEKKTLGEILARAGKIYQIRLKRHKN